LNSGVGFVGQDDGNSVVDVRQRRKRLLVNLPDFTQDRSNGGQ